MALGAALEGPAAWAAQARAGPFRSNRQILGLWLGLQWQSGSASGVRARLLEGARRTSRLLGERTTWHGRVQPHGELAVPIARPTGLPGNGTGYPTGWVLGAYSR